MSRIGFIIFRIFFIFFTEFSCPGRVWTEFGIKFFFFTFSAYLIPVLGKNNVGRRFCNFLNFFAIFFGIFLPGSVMNEIQDENFFVSFSAYLDSFGLKIMPERGFLIFWIFLLFVSEFSTSDRVWTRFGTKFFLSLCPPISSRFH